MSKLLAFLLISISSLNLSAINAAEMEKKSRIHLTDLYCENLIAPLGIDNVNPHFSWKIIDSASKGGQKYYEIQVASDSIALLNGNADYWNSGKVRSEASVMVPYTGKELMPRSLYFWRVRVGLQNGKVSDWSEITKFSIGILDNKIQGEYIGLSAEGGDVRSPLLKKKFAVKDKGTFLLYVNSLGYHEVYLNGKKVSRNVLSPAVSQLNKRSLIITYDVTPYINEGENELLLWLGQGWYKKTTYGADYDGPLVKAELNMLKGGKWNTLFTTDKSWLGRESGYSDTGTWQAIRFGGERVDGRILQKDLSPAALDKLPWFPVTSVNVRQLVASQQMCESNRIQETVLPKSITKLGDNVWQIDMGKVLTGWFELQLPQLPAGHEITMAYSDYMDKEGKIIEQGESDLFIASGKEKDVFCNKFNHHAYRYIKISNLPIEPEKEQIKGYLIHSDYRQASTFECSDADMNAIHNMIRYTAQCLTFSGYMVDCPHLERAGYGGDGNSSTMTIQTMFDVSPLFANWLQAWSDAMQEEGSLPHIAPNPGSGGGGPYWCAFVVLAPWRTYVNYNDSRLIERYYTVMKQWMGYVDKYTVDGLLKRWPDTSYRGWYLGDWLTPTGVDAGAQLSVDLVNNCVISECLGVMAKIANYLGKPMEADSYIKRKNKLNALLHKTYFHPEENTYATGSQLDMAYPMLVGVVPDTLYGEVKAKLLSLTEQKHKGHIACGLVGIPILTEWTIRNKEVDFMYDMMKKREYLGYLYMIDNGATTTWESWDAERSRVHNCYNGIGTWFYQALGGLRNDENSPGYKQVIIDPQIPQGVTWAKTTKNTVYGLITVHWELKDNNKLTIHVNLPVGVEGTVIIPQKAVSCQMNGKKMNRSKREIKVGSGTNDFVISL